MCKTVLHLEFLPELNPVDYLRGHVELLVQFFDNLVLNHPVGPSQTSLLPLPGPEGQHVIVLIGIGFPEQAQEREFQLLPPVFPIVVDYLCELLNQLVLEQFLVLPLDEGHHPALAPGKIHVLPRLQLHLHHHLLQKIGSQDPLAPEQVPVLVSLDESMVDLSEFVLTGKRQVKVGLETDVVGWHPRKILLDGDGRDDVDFRSDNVVLAFGLVGSGGGEGWSNGIFDRLNCLELLLGADEFERLRPVIFVTIAHWR